MPTDDNNTDDGIDGAVCQNIIVSVHYSLYLAFPSGKDDSPHADPFILPSPLGKVAAKQTDEVSKKAPPPIKDESACFRGTT